ncbi:MAG: tRNA uridine-5-carboxymethylaminomethyl(34) synthesis enzyme MnmG [Planctomycetes bacterium]|nr:tRNA uridine-5-carboxymethylaminomethyl(34) synthesis enzyme MnmG [Planctomycetota bacterium]
MLKNEFDVVVVGGGHAGIEAAAVAARRNVRVALLNLTANSIGRMSCNPAIGGIGKGQLAREIDALGGLMGIIADESAIQFRVLNTSKGRAVQSPRAQCDRDAYEKIAQRLIAEIENITVIEGEATDLRFDDDNNVCAVVVDNDYQLSCKAAILTTGTFLEGMLHLGLKSSKGGRFDEGASHPLGETLRELGVPTARLKTGTPPRIALDSVDLSKMAEQPGDKLPTPFSFLSGDLSDRKQVHCWLTKTTARTQEIVRDNLNKTAMYSGRIEGKGPRYCPSLEDKAVRFSDRDSHTIFLEPEAVGSNILYANGISTSLPEDVQQDFVRTCIGLENAIILQAGYAVEYTHVAPRSLLPTLEYRNASGLYFAGQICGTSGYEEAAAQGFIAGLNAALAIQKLPEFVLQRHQAYIGVLIDDLVVSDPSEPYRMFTSRAEHRLLLRHDNADLRLTPLAQQLEISSPQRDSVFAARQQNLAIARQALLDKPYPLQVANSGARSLLDMCKQPKFIGWPAIFEMHPDLLALEIPLTDWQTIESDALYAGYASRQQAWVDRGSQRESMQIPTTFDYQAVNGLRSEARLCLQESLPSTLGQASRMAGVTPADLAILEIALVRWQRAGKNLTDV